MKKVSRKSEAVLQGLLDYFSETRSEELLPEVTKSLEEIVTKSKETREIVVASVILFDFTQIEKLKMILKKLLNVNLPIVNKIDKKLIGGFTVRIGDWFLDASLIHQLQIIKRSLLS